MTRPDAPDTSRRPRSADPDASLDHAEPTILARMLSLDAATPLWTANELAAMWLHQLDAPVTVDLIDHDPMNDQTVRTLSTRVDGSEVTFRQLLNDPAPSPQLLELAKDFAKANRAAGDGLPAEIATMLYYALIAAGLVHAGQRLTDLPDASLRKGLNWAISQGWVDNQTRTLLREALEGMGQ